MKRIVLVSIVLVAGSCLSRGEMSSPSSDVMGAHLNYGRGCSGCHAPHIGPIANGDAAKPNVERGTQALWGEDVTGFYREMIHRDKEGRSEDAQAPSAGDGTPDVPGVTACMSCHDGNLAERATMQNEAYEKLPVRYGQFDHVPTLLTDGSPFGEMFDHHPVGLRVVIPCGGEDGWDCSSKEGVINMNGAKSSLFVKNYGMFVKPGRYNNQPVVVCTTCHDPHLMDVVNVGPKTRSGLPKGRYSTMFFLRGPYNTSNKIHGNNQAAQFCRQCHAAESNEMNGGAEATIT